MKSIALISMLILAVINWEKKSVGQPAEVIFSTDKPSYSLSDTIVLQITNNSSDDLFAGLRCGIYLEMSYQKKVDDSSSEKLQFGYMTLRCMTTQVTIPTDSTYSHQLPAELFNSKGTFRLIIDLVDPLTNSNQQVVSDEFRVE
jgi:hypothetical protein